MIQYALGFKSSFNQNVNAGFGFQSKAHLTVDTYYTLKHGYDTIPTNLCERLAKNGTNVQLNSEVVKIHEEKGEFPIKVEYVVDGTTEEVSCKFLVLAIPKLALLKLSNNNEFLSSQPNFNTYLNSVISDSLVKINLYFKNQWWADLNITDGPNHTDLKLGTVYPISPISKNALKEHEKLSDYPGSLTIYCDYENSIYWQSLQMSGAVYKSKLKCQCDLLQSIPDSVNASEMVVKVAMDQLQLLFQQPNIGCHKPENPIGEIIPDWPILATYTHWTEETFGDSTHAWKVGYDDSIISPAMYKILGDKIGIIGESYSIAQQWVEGSLHHTQGFIDQHCQQMNK